MQGLGGTIVLILIIAALFYPFASCGSTSGAWCSSSDALEVKGPGLVIIVPAIQQMVKVDLRTVTMDVPPQDVISRDNVSVKVSAVIYFASWTRSGPSSRWRTFWWRPASLPNHTALGARQARARPDARRA
jgi:regulator of protease activity HflC (stomatin/prohibitin superfamily)